MPDTELRAGNGSVQNTRFKAHGQGRELGHFTVTVNSPGNLHAFVCTWKGQKKLKQEERD